MMRKMDIGMALAFMCASALFFFAMLGATNDGQMLGYLFLGAACGLVGCAYLGGE